MDKQVNKLENAGCTDIKPYTLVSNYGYTFSKGGVGYDLRYWENCYGVYGGGWHIDSIGNNYATRSPYFGTDFDGAVEWIKNNL
jgi:hypothetical protein